MKRHTKQLLIYKGWIAGWRDSSSCSSSSSTAKANTENSPKRLNCTPWKLYFRPHTFGTTNVPHYFIRDSQAAAGWDRAWDVVPYGRRVAVVLIVHSHHHHRAVPRRLPILCERKYNETSASLNLSASSNTHHPTAAPPIEGVEELWTKSARRDLTVKEKRTEKEELSMKDFMWVAFSNKSWKGLVYIAVNKYDLQSVCLSV